MGPVSRTFSVLKGGCQSTTWCRPVSFSVIQTCLPSGVAAIFGQNGLTCLTVATILCVAVEMTSVSGLNEEQTYPYLSSGEKMVMPGPGGVMIRVFSSKVLPSSTST